MTASDQPLLLDGFKGPIKLGTWAHAINYGLLAITLLAIALYSVAEIFETISLIALLFLGISWPMLGSLIAGISGIFALRQARLRKEKTQAIVMLGLAGLNSATLIFLVIVLLNTSGYY